MEATPKRFREVTLPYKPRPSERVIEIRRSKIPGKVNVTIVELLDNPEAGRMQGEGA
jgi:hypothetical protein